MNNEIIRSLINKKKSYHAISSFSKSPGIYALFFHGSEFPLPGYNPKEDEIIYIGKTESSQASRDRDTHFSSGKTGSSTIRRTFGALLREKLELKSIIRSQSDIIKGRISHYKFDQLSEEKLTKWMVQNLGLSFYEVKASASEIDRLETHLIQIQKPILNIDRKKPNNPWKTKIQAKRKETGHLAYKNREEAIEIPIRLKQEIKTATRIISDGSNVVHKYESIWKKLRPVILKAVSTGKSTEINIGKAPFEAVGNRKLYSFRLEMSDGSVANNISGSAVARDLARVLISDQKFMACAKERKFIFKLDSQFTFKILV